MFAVQMDRVVQTVEAHPDDAGTRLNSLYCLAELATAEGCAHVEAFLERGTFFPHL
jgi:hypothetical protein